MVTCIMSHLPVRPGWRHRWTACIPHTPGSPTINIIWRDIANTVDRVKFKDTMTKWPVQKRTLWAAWNTRNKKTKQTFRVNSFMYISICIYTYLFLIKMISPRNVELPPTEFYQTFVDRVYTYTEFMQYISECLVSCNTLFTFTKIRVSLNNKYNNE